MSLSISKSNSSSGSSNSNSHSHAQGKNEGEVDYYQGVDHDSSNDLFGGFMPDPPDPDQAYFEAYAALCLSNGIEEVAS